MKNILITLLIFVTASASGQLKQYLYYMDGGLNAVSKSRAVYKGIGIMDNGVFELKLYNISDNTLRLIEHFKDYTLQQTEGLYQSYYPGMLPEQQGNYAEGKEDGLWKRWDSAGHTIDSTLYSNGVKIIEVHTGYYKDGKLDSFIVNDVKNDLLKQNYYNDKGQLTSETIFIGQKGIIKYYDSANNEKTDTVFSRLQVAASFPGGDAAWNAYIANQINKYIDALKLDGRSGTCILKFMVDKEGNIRDVQATTMQGTALAKIAVNAITKGPKWIPANQHGRPVNAYRMQPVTINMSN